MPIFRPPSSSVACWNPRTAGGPAGARHWRRGGLYGFGAKAGSTILTDTAIRRATAGDRDYKMADSGPVFAGDGRRRQAVTLEVPL
jgi:hypothetical protein